MSRYTPVARGVARGDRLAQAIHSRFDDDERRRKAAIDEADPDTDQILALLDRIPNPDRKVPVPRRTLRLMAGGARPATGQGLPRRTRGDPLAGLERKAYSQRPTDK